MHKYTFREHFLELKNRLLKIIVFFVFAFCISYFFKEEIYSFFLRPLIDLSENSDRKIIYTGLTEAFFSYIKLASFFALLLTMPIICYHLYFFISPGLVGREKKIAASMMLLSPILFYSGTFFVFYIVMPKAWEFFLSYEKTNLVLPLVMEAKISEYLGLVTDLMFAFGVAFQLPIVLIMLCILGVINADFLREKRRISLVIIFIASAILTPPDVISQIALAIPLVLLYEMSIMLCNFIKKQGN